MFNALKYIKNLEDVGFRRDQAEAQVQILIDAVEGELVRKSDLDQLKAEIAHEFTQSEYRVVTKVSIVMGTMLTLFVGVLALLIKL